jgi:hypothetical protein
MLTVKIFHTEIICTVLFFLTKIVLTVLIFLTEVVVLYCTCIFRGRGTAGLPTASKF